MLVAEPERSLTQPERQVKVMLTMKGADKQKKGTKKPAQLAEGEAAGKARGEEERRVTRLHKRVATLCSPCPGDSRLRCSPMLVAASAAARRTRGRTRVRRGARCADALGAAACGETPGLQCTVVTVPLDRTGRVPGTIALHVEYLPADGPQRGRCSSAGGPGQGSAHVFGLEPSAVQLTATCSPATASSPTMTAARRVRADRLPDSPTRGQRRPAAALGGRLRSDDRPGPRLLQHRRARGGPGRGAGLLGVDKLALYGVSYGTKLSLSYAWPTRARRAPPARLGAASGAAGSLQRGRPPPDAGQAERLLH
jgi:hypothetical protein